MRKATCLLVSVLLLITLVAGCSTGGTQKENAVLYHSIASEPFITLDPSAENSNGIYILQNVYETLTRYNTETNEIEPCLAESWKSNDDGTVWDFVLRSGVKFHDGSQMNAEAVKKSIDRTMTMGKGAAYIWGAVESIEVVDEMTVRFICKDPAAVDLIATAAYAAYIISPAACEKDSDWFNAADGNDGGSGPYTVKSLVTGDQVVLEAFDGYWKEWKKGSYKNILLKKSVESSARRQLMESGEAQISSGFSTTDTTALKSSDKVNISYVTTYDNIVIFPNTEKAPLDNADFRRALAYAFPYEEVVTNVLENRGAQSRGLVPPGLWGHDENVLQYTYDLDKAREYLQKSGVDPSARTLEFAIQSGTTEYRDLAQLWQVNLKQLGINIDIRERNWDSHWEYAKNPNPDERQDLFIMIWWPDYASPISWYQSLVHSEDEIFFNLSYIKDPELDAKIDEAALLTATDRAGAEKLYNEVQEKVVEEAYFILPYDRVEVVGVSKAISGFNRSPAYPTAVQYFEITQAQ